MRTSPYATFASNPVGGIFGILAWPRTYLNLIYLLIGFPLGLAYFVFYVVGGSLGAGLSILGIGLVILFLLILAAWALALFERALANALLGAEVPSPGHTATEEGGWPWVKSVVGNPVTWKGLVFQLLKFPLGLASWIVTIVVLAVVGGFIAAPLVIQFGGTIQIDPWFVADTQLYFRQSLPHLLDDLHVYDEQTRAALQRNLEVSQALEDERIARGVEFALLTRAEQGALPDPSDPSAR